MRTSPREKEERKSAKEAELRERQVLNELPVLGPNPLQSPMLAQSKANDIRPPY